MENMEKIKNYLEKPLERPSNFSLWATAFYMVFSRKLPEPTSALANLYGVYTGDWSLIWRKAVIRVVLVIVCIVVGISMMVDKGMLA